MHELPKIALARLKARAADREDGSVLPASGPGAFQGAEHTDANLLAAFVEKSLSEKERAQVLSHLAACAGCREVAALTLPTDEEITEPVRAEERHSWGPWHLLRWGAMAAALGAVAIVVALNPEIWRRRASVVNQVRPTPPAQTVMSARQTPPSPSIVPPNSEADAMKKETEARKSKGEVASLGKAAAPSGNEPLNGNAEAKRQVTMMASVQPPAPAKVENPTTVQADRHDERPGSSFGAPATPAPQPLSAPAAASESTSEVAAMAKAGTEPEAAAAGTRATDQGVVFRTSVGGSLAAPPPAKTATSAGNSAAVRVYGQAPVMAMRVANKPMEASAVPSAAVWSVSSKGRVQHSSDGGKTFEEISVAPRVKFHAVAALGRDVWAGGTGGALFHSGDAGATWTRVGIDSGGNIVAQSIVGIQMRDALHLTVTLANGERWATQDGGQQWQKKP